MKANSRKNVSAPRNLPGRACRKLLLASAAALTLSAPFAEAANSLPLSGAWNIAASGKASSSGELLFRVTSADGEDPVEVTVFVQSGANETGIASSIRKAFSSSLRADRFNVEPGEGGNVLLANDKGGAEFSLELVDSGVENVRVVVQSATPIAPPTVPRQATPANPPAVPATPQAPGDASPPPNTAPPANASQPAAPPPANSPPMPNPSPPPNATGGSGAPASAPPPNATPGGSAPASAPPPNATPGGSAPASAPPPT